MGFTTSDKCTHCTQDTTDTYIHAFWNCTPIQKFWTQAVNYLSHTLGCHIPVSPQLCILGDLSLVQLNHHIKTALFTALIIAKKTILLHWKSRQQINIPQWKNMLIDHIAVEKMNASINHNTASYDNSWSTFAKTLTSTVV